MKKKLVHQHGDVLLFRVGVPEGAVRRPREERGLVLAEGEATGHAHTITDDGCALLEHDGRVFLAVEKPVTLRHEEHKPQVVQPGEYEVRRVQEVDPFNEEVHSVSD